MNTSNLVRKYRWGWAGLILAAAAGLSSGGQPLPPPQHERGPEQAGALDMSRELLALHRLSDPSFFRCYLCRLELPITPANTRISDSLTGCEAHAVGWRQL